MLELKLNRKFFLTTFLDPISKMGSICVLHVVRDKIICTMQSQDGSLYSYIEHFIDNPTDEKVVLNINDVSKLIGILNIIDDDEIVLKYSDKDNKIKYSAGSNRFTMHLLDPAVMFVKQFNFSAVVTSQKYVSEFSMDLVEFRTVLKAAAFSGSDKLYLTSNGSAVTCELTDKKKPNIDSFATIVSNDYTGKSIEDFCLTITVLKNISSIIKDKIKIRISSANAILFEYSDNISVFKFATAALRN